MVDLIPLFSLRAFKDPISQVHLVSEKLRARCAGSRPALDCGELVASYQSPCREHLRPLGKTEQPNKRRGPWRAAQGPWTGRAPTPE